MKAFAAVCGLTTCLLVPQAVSAPPGSMAAEGFGADTPGGRGGREIAVTTLADEGPGSLRAAVTAAGPRTVVFRVAGLITLASPLVIREPFLTLDGQGRPATACACAAARSSSAPTTSSSGTCASGRATAADRKSTR